MVMRGQFLERPTIIKSGELFLEGLFHRGSRSPGVLIVSPLAEGGSPMELPITAELAWAMHQARRATLRFNPRGFGASQGARGDAPESLEDARAALHSLRQSLEPEAEHASRVAVVAIQDGSSTALELARENPDLLALILVSPPAGLRDEPLSSGPPTLVMLPEGTAWATGGDPGTARIEEIAGTDSKFLRGLPRFGHAVTRFLDGLG
jgi:alpha/beta superfamily hydrolase